jgi:hypothetical protein
MNAVAEQATSTASPSVTGRTRKETIEILTEDEVSALIGKPLYHVRGMSCAGTLPGGLWRSGSEYLIAESAAKRLRAVAAGSPLAVVYERESRIEQKRAWDTDESIRQTIAAADAKCEAEKAERLAKQRAETALYLKREAQRVGADTTDSKGRKVNAVGDRVV